MKSVQHGTNVSRVRPHEKVNAKNISQLQANIIAGFRESLVGQEESKVRLHKKMRIERLL